MTRIDHYRLCLDTAEGGEVYTFNRETDALRAFRKHAKRRAVSDAQLMGVEADGEFVRTIAHADNTRDCVNGQDW